MVYVKLMSGLGNQMFQYAAGLRLARKHGTSLGLETKSFRRDKLRRYGLDVFNISGQVLSPPKLWNLKAKGRRLLNRRATLTDGSKPQNLREHAGGFKFDASILAAADNVCLDGYFQSEKYFADIKDEVRQEFSLSIKPGESAEQMRKKIEDSHSVSLHVRLTDYKTDPIMFPQPLDYYLTCAHQIRERLGHVHFFVFSDDPVWVEANLKLPGVSTHVCGNNDYQGCLDLWLMSRCRHNIISNSTFSWWSAWLNPHPGKLVFSPKRWFRDAVHDSPERIPETWQRV
jgi:hypothetical protein